MKLLNFDRGFFIFDKNWIYDNEFVRSLSHAEFRVLVFLLSSALKLSKRYNKAGRGKKIATIYRKNGTLFVNASQRTIAENCNMNRITVHRVMSKFKDYGVLIKVPDAEGNGDYHIIGFSANKEGKYDYFLTDSSFIRSGEKLPEQLKNYFRNHYEGNNFPAARV
jgi:DNA-binding MarR family transcriptional regulator